VVVDGAAEATIDAGGDADRYQAAECDYRQVGQQFVVHPDWAGALPRPEPVDEEIRYRSGQESRPPGYRG
jgi:hypothetical protein